MLAIIPSAQPCKQKMLYNLKHVSLDFTAQKQHKFKQEFMQRCIERVNGIKSREKDKKSTAQNPLSDSDDAVNILCKEEKIEEKEEEVSNTQNLTF
jgi:hypothetical protein